MSEIKKETVEKIGLGTQITKTMMKRLNDHCKEEGRTVTHVIEKALDAYLPDPKQDF